MTRSQYASFVLLPESGADSREVYDALALNAEKYFTGYEVLFFGDPLSKEDGDEFFSSSRLVDVCPHEEQSADLLIRAALERAIGDFVVIIYAMDQGFLSDGFLTKLSGYSEMSNIIGFQSDQGCLRTRVIRSAFQKLRPYRRVIWRPDVLLLSRRAIGMLLRQQMATSRVSVALSHMQIDRRVVSISAGSHGQSRRRLVLEILDLLSVLLRAPRRLDYVPMVLSGACAVIAGMFGVYSLAVGVFFKRPPEGWVSLMLVTSFGASSILFSIALVAKKLSETYSLIYSQSERN